MAEVAVNARMEAAGMRSVKAVEVVIRRITINRGRAAEVVSSPYPIFDPISIRAGYVVRNECRRQRGGRAIGPCAVRVAGYREIRDRIPDSDRPRGAWREDQRQGHGDSQRLTCVRIH